MTSRAPKRSKADERVDATTRRLADAGVIGLIWLDDQLIIRKTLGVLAEVFKIGEPVTDGLVVLVGLEGQIADLARAGAAGAAVHVPNFALMSAVGEERARMNVSVYRDLEAGGYVVLLVRVTADDVRDLIVEDEIRKRRIADGELKRINEQLEEFAYIISHDLKAPLRALRYHSEDLREAVRARRIDRGLVERAASDVAGTVRRMSNMLEGLLEYSRIGRQHEQAEMVDLGALADAIIENLGRPDGFVVEREGRWPTLRTLAVPFDLVLRNLIENAIKHHDRPNGRVVVTMREQGPALVFEVGDDGPGIPPEWHGAIFQPFKRVRDEVDPESSGIGLALVKRTVESFGGRIEVRSDPALARGTRFLVTWPKRLAVRTG